MGYREPRINPVRFAGYSWQRLTERFQGNERNQALAIWQWSAVRFSSYGTAQERYYRRYGAAATFDRINRVRRWLGFSEI